MQLQPVEPPPSAPAGWYPDPWQHTAQRFWDGRAWTVHTSSARTGAPAGARTEPPRARTDIRGGWTAILGFFGALAISLLFARAAVATGVSEASLTVLVAGQLGLWTGFTMTAFMVTHRRAGGSFADLGLRVPTRGEVSLGIATGVAGLIIATRVAVFLQYLFPNASPSSATHLVPAAQPGMTVIVVTGALACIGAPVFEEMFFRGIVQPILTGRLGVPAAIVVQAVLFGAAHFQLGMTFDDAVVRCGTVVVLGLLLGCLRQKTGRLGAGMVAHATNNLIVVVLMVLAVSR